MDTVLKTTPVGSAQRARWRVVVIACLAFWLSSSLLMDFILMPSLYTAGMLASADFVPAGYSLFWWFNRVEVMCGALVLTGIWILRSYQDVLHRKGLAPVLMAILLLTIALLYMYVLAPSMSALSLDLNLFEPITRSTAQLAAMVHLQISYLGVEFLKLLVTGTLLGLCWHDRV
ncbi:MAG: hypothetical protein NZ772_16060 [Cyanobacteria bacterium]|nr:hypothetical protein [Cyanobacteriota bacterium]MDW8202847.1 hypothetical protein [Cyanobacteriota bacterium SKYGB_h_bin112]